MIVPTARAVIALLVLTPLVLLLAVTIPSLWGVGSVVALLAPILVLMDAFLAGRLRHVELSVPKDVEIGATNSIQLNAQFQSGRPSRVEAVLACDPRLVMGGRMAFALEPAADGWVGAQDFTPNRRGTGRMHRPVLRWTGPMGLGARQAEDAQEHDVRVWPNVAAARSSAMQTFLKNAQIGLLARRIRGEGTQFESLTEYQSGMERRRIDWKRSARHVHLYAKEYEAERDNQIVLAFDCGQAMCEELGGVPRLDRAVSAGLATSLVALKGGDRVSIFGFAGRPEVSSPFVTTSTDFHRLQQAAAGLEYRSEAPNFTLALATLASRLKRRSLIVVFSDFTDLTSAELMIESIGRLLTRHVVLFVTMAEEELEQIAHTSPDDTQALAMAVSADLLLEQRASVTYRLRQIGVDVIEAPWNMIGPKLLDAYLQIKRSGAIG